jgi:hypothetical protein
VEEEGEQGRQMGYVRQAVSAETVPMNKGRISSLQLISTRESNMVDTARAMNARRGLL